MVPTTKAPIFVPETSRPIRKSEVPTRLPNVKIPTVVPETRRPIRKSEEPTRLPNVKAPSTAHEKHPTRKPRLSTKRPVNKHPSRVPETKSPLPRPAARPHPKTSGSENSYFLDVYLKMMSKGYGKQNIQVKQSVEASEEKE